MIVGLIATLTSKGLFFSRPLIVLSFQVMNFFIKTNSFMFSLSKNIPKSNKVHVIVFHPRKFENFAKKLQDVRS